MADFRLQDFASIASSMLKDLTALCDKITDYTEGAVARSMLESVAIQIQALDISMYQMAQDAIRTGTFRNFDFNRLPATFSTQLVRFTVPLSNETIIIPAGTGVDVPGSDIRVYQTLSDLIIPPQTPTGDVAARCLTPGSAGNTPANTVVEISDGAMRISGFTVTNLAPFLSGVDQESEEERLERFRLYIAGLSRGTAPAIVSAARSVQILDASGVALERVTGAFVHEPWQEPTGYVGHIELYVDNGSGTSSPDLINLVRNTVVGYTDTSGVKHPGYVAAGVETAVLPVTAVPLTVVCVIQVAPGNDPTGVSAAVVAAIGRYLTGVGVFQPVILSSLIAVVMGIVGVQDVTFLTPTGNTAVAFDQRIVAGPIEARLA
jgi:uncharacterized phage protein gp47/JayE